MSITSRERKIIHLLLKSDELTVKDIANKLEVSTRTIHRDLKSVEKILSRYHLKLVKKPGVGLSIMGKVHDKNELQSVLSNVSVYDFSSEERQSVILATLLEMNEPVKLFTLADELKVTEATVSHDLDQLEKVLSTFHLVLIKKRGYGVEIEGSEEAKREALSYLITKYVNPFEFVTLIKDRIQKKSIQQLNSISNRLLDFVNLEYLSKIEKAVKSARNTLPYVLADSAYIGLIVHLALAIERLQKGETIKFDKNFLQEIEETKEYEIAKSMIDQLEKELKLNIPTDEIGYITMHLMGAKIRVNQDYLIEESSIDIAFRAKALIQYVSEHINRNLTKNDTLLHDLVAHLKPAIHRLHLRMQIKNPLIKEIMDDYNDLFYLIKNGVQETFPELDFPDAEIGYLVLHFASTILGELKLRALVICASGIGTSKMLAMKLVQRIPVIKKVDNRSLFDLQKVNLKQYDIIISTIPLLGFTQEYFQVSPMLTNEEIHRIKEKIKQKKLSHFPEKKDVEPEEVIQEASNNAVKSIEMIHNYSQAFLELLQSLFILRVVEKQTVQKVLEIACEALEADQYIVNKKSVINRLMKRVEYSGAGIPSTAAAFYHTRSNEIIKPSFTICRLTHPLIVQGMDAEPMKIDTILLMLAPEKANQEVLEVLSFLSSLLVREEQSIVIFSSSDETTVNHYLAEQFQKILREKICGKGASSYDKGNFKSK
mgnify:CR=1 FL=1